ncbi:MAG TPA: GNAT family N-acetyltransferase [Candidatus Limnocylindria bacterium]|nr:GNAT family N-acetyltransferase [Candidatus Limnocylindria bacterium]
MGKCDGMVHLRRAHQADAEQIARVHVLTWQSAYRELLPAPFLAGLSVEARRGHWANQLAVLSAERTPWLAEADGEVVGFAHVGPSRDDDAGPTTGEVYAVYVLPDCWDRGLGRNLLQHGERDLLAHAYDEATLWVLDSNERARRFYEAAGWHTDGATKTERLGSVELSEVRYRRALNPSRMS